MSVAFALSVGLVVARYRDPPLLAIGLAGVIASIVRLATVLLLRREALTSTLYRSRARTLEWWFAGTFIAFALCLGTFGANVFSLNAPEAHMLTICLLVGYCAGVAAGVGLRPRIAVLSMTIAIGPTILAAALRGDAIYTGMSAIVTALLVGGSHSVLVRHRTSLVEIGKRVTFGSLARRDDLTSLPNRLALREWFEEYFTLAPDQFTIAIHYLDLNGFKPVNDRYGHLVGDALLTAVAGRLAGALRGGDIVARLGGDEFAILQRGLRHAGEAELLVQRLVAALRQPFSIGEHEMHVSASIGSVTTSDQTCDLEQLLRQADQALYVAKGRRKDRSSHIVAA